MQTAPPVTDGFFSYDLYQQAAGEPERSQMPVPAELALPSAGDNLHSRWAALLADLLADVRGQPRRRYPTFRDGWRYQAAIDAVRSAGGWVDLPASSDRPATTTA